MIRIAILAAGLCLSAAPVSAQMSEAEARKALFPVKGHSVQVSGKLTQLERKIVTGIIPLMGKELRQPVRYYASIAYSPDDGMVHESLQAAMNHHNTSASDKAAVAACNRLKTKGAKSCQVAARVVPKGYKARALTLSVDATAAFNGTYRKASGAKAFAVSPSTGKWGMGKSDRTALAACRAKNAANDCEIVIRN